MTSTRFLRLFAVGLVATVFLAACGASDADSSATTEAPTTTEAATTTAPEPEPTEATDDEAAVEAAPTEVAVTTYYGEEKTVPFDPQTVVVLDFAALDTIDALGLGDRVVGVPWGTTLPPHLAAYEATENVGNLFEPDFEAINALQPDLIIAGGRSQPLVAELEEIAPTIDYTIAWGSDPFVQSFEMNTRAIGQIFDAETEVSGALEAFAAEAQTIAADAADSGTGIVLLTSGGEVSAYGPDPEGRFDFVYNVLGITPALDQVAIDTHGDSISFEAISEANPDVMIVLDRDAAIGQEGESAQAILDNDLVNGTNAAQNNNIVYVDTAKWYLSFGGLTSVETMLGEVASVVD